MSGEPGPAPVRVPKAVGATEEVVAVGMTEEVAVEMPEEVVAPVDVPQAAACAMETEDVVALVDVPEAAACAVETEEVATLADVSEETEATSTSGGSEDSDSSATLDEDSEESRSVEEVPEAVPTVAAGMAEDDSWYVSIQDFVRWEAERDTSAPPDLTRAHIPHDEVQASAPRRDVTQAEFAVAALAARGQVITFPFNFKYYFCALCLTILFFLVESGPRHHALSLGSGPQVLPDVGAFPVRATSADGVWTLPIHFSLPA